MQGNYRGTPNWGRSNNDDTVFRPLEVFSPSLLSRMEQGNTRTRLRICCFNLITLVTIANWAGQPQVRLIISATFREGNNMLDLQPRHDEMLWT